MRTRQALPPEIEVYRDQMWRRTEELRVETPAEAERLVEAAGFCWALVDSRRPGASLYVAVCGRREAHLPRNVQKDPETSLAWNLKDELMRRSQVYYGKLLRGRATFVSRRLVPYFNALWGLPRRREAASLSSDARAILKVLRREWDMATVDIRRLSQFKDRARCMKALDELQRAMKVIPGDVLYEPAFTYIWTLAEGRFSGELARRINPREALREVARAFLTGAGMTLRGELSSVTGLSRPDAGLGNHALVEEGFAERIAEGVYRLTDLDQRLERLAVS